ncbi:hypothetical protein WJX72_004342 [[Myrmecia] bisecta]|uniref:MLO-like protein n=1 Tax=[Myrmecia] bisecta TaxID=41462 RepID=A0AAW1R714_9CHLO
MTESIGGTSLLETPPYVIALVFLCVLLITQGVDKALELIRKQMEKYNKKGLLAAMGNMTTELMLLGVATLILVAFQSNIGRICVQAKRYVGHTWLDNVHGCACCLAQTEGVSECYLQARGCVGNADLGACCEGGKPSTAGIINFQFQDDTRVCDAILGGGLDNSTAAVYVDPSGTANITDAGSPGHRRLLASEAAATSATQCAGPGGKVQVGWSECPNENSRPVIGAKALHQVHLFIFILGVMHILLGILVIIAAALRVKLWKHWRSHEDAHVLAVHAAVTEHKHKLGLLGSSASPTPHSQSRRPSHSQLPDIADATAGDAVQVDIPDPASHAVGRGQAALQRVLTERAFLGKLQRARTILKRIHGSGDSSDGATASPHGQLLRDLEADEERHREDSDSSARSSGSATPSSTSSGSTPDSQASDVASPFASLGEEALALPGDTPGDAPGDSSAAAASQSMRHISSSAIFPGSTGQLDDGESGAPSGVSTPSAAARSTSAKQDPDGGPYAAAPRETAQPASTSPADSTAHERAPGSHSSAAEQTSAADALAALPPKLKSPQASLGRKTPKGSKKHHLVAHASGHSGSGGKRHWPGRRNVLRHALHRAEEFLHCMLRQFMPNIIRREELSIMRASFHLTHGVDTTEFDFMAYLTDSLDDDFAQIVGLGLPMWIFIIVFILLSHKIGWCIWVFIILAGGLLFAVNTKLIWIARYVTRGGHVHRLKPGIFWLNRPWLLLPVIKFLVFFVSFVYSNSIFFTTQFGPNSCFFSRTGFQGNPFPWWSLLLVNTIYFVSLSCVTLPLFSLVVQMGGDYKAALLPEPLRERFERTASLAEAKKKRGKLQRLVSGMLPMQKDNRE